MSEQKLKIYKNIVCLEMQSPEANGWWYAGTNLAFTPINILHLNKVKYVVLEGSRKRILVAILRIKDQDRMAAINLVRSDTHALKTRGLWYSEIEEPFTKINYSPLPNRKTYQPK